MSTSGLCPTCRAVIPADAPGGLCPSCALLGVVQPTIIMPSAGGAPTREEIAAAFPDLEVLEVIGQGGMGIVFKVRQPRLDRLVALKILPPHLAAQPGFAERFTREARALARLNHPHIVTVYDFGESGGFYYLLMEFVNGVNLRQAMRAGVSPEQALLLVPHICEALQFAHDHGVLHRDIKPENILLDTTGSPKLADFGIAKMAGENAGGLTLSGAALGTAAYMAPEQIERPATVDHRADIYSLGVVLYEMLTGELPLGRFAAPSGKAKIGPGVDEVVMRALEKERERRQQSATEMKTQVEGASGASAAHGLRYSNPGAGWEPDRSRRGLKHFFRIMTAVCAVLIPLSAVGRWRSLSPAELACLTAVFAVLSKMWPSREGERGGMLPRPQPAPVPPPLPVAAPGERRSRRTLFGLPLYHIAGGMDPVTGRARVARGILAIGPEARGFLAIGGRATGGIAIGGLASGVVAVGGITAGIFAFGGLAFALLCAAGGVAIAPLAMGGLAVGFVAVGGTAAGQEVQADTIIGSPSHALGSDFDFLRHLAVTGGISVGALAVLVFLLALFASRHSDLTLANPRPRSLLWLPVVLVAAVLVFLAARGNYSRRRPEQTDSYQSAPAVDTVRENRIPFIGRWEKGSVELVAVARNPSDNSPWWRMDGLRIAEGGFTSSGGGCHANRGERAYEFVIRVSDLPPGASSPEWLIEHARATAGGGEPALREKPETSLPGYVSMAAALPEFIDRTNIKIGLAFEKWETISASSPGNFMGISRSHGGVPWDVIHGSALETRDGELSVTFSHSRHTDWEARVVAVNTAGEEIATGRQSRVNDQSEWRFPSLPLASVREFRFQVRRFRWVEFRGVSLAPEQ